MTEIENNEELGKDFANFVKSRYAAANDRDKARYIIAFMMVYRLSRPGKAYDRKTLLTVPMIAKVARQIEKEVSSKEWSRVFLDRMVAKGNIVKTGGGASTFFKSDSEEQRIFLRGITENCLYGDGGELKKVLWPEDYHSPTEDAPEEEETAVDVSEESPDSSSSEDPSLIIVQQVTEQLKQVAGHLASLYTGLQEFEKRLDAKVQTLVDESSQIAGHTRKALQAIENEDRALLKSVGDRLVEFGSRRASILNQLDSEGRKGEKLAQELEAILNRKKA